MACDFQPFSFYLGGKRNYWGLPNNPDYDLPQLYGSACDTLGVHVNEISKPTASLSVFPNPSTGRITISSESFLIGKVRIVNSLGEIMIIKTLVNGKLSIDDLPAGIYYAGMLENGNEYSAVKFIVIK